MAYEIDQSGHVSKVQKFSYVRSVLQAPKIVQLDMQKHMQIIFPHEI